MRRLIAVAVAAGSCLLLVSCAETPVGNGASSQPSEAVQCVPEVIEAVPSTARPGDKIELSARAASCEVEFTAGRTLHLGMKRSHQDDATVLPLATVEASPEGAYQIAATVPVDAGAGDWVVLVTDGLAPTSCQDTGGGAASCARPEAYLRVVAVDEG